MFRTASGKSTPEYFIDYELHFHNYLLIYLRCKVGVYSPFVRLLLGNVRRRRTTLVT